MDKEELKTLALSYVGTPHVNGGNIKGAGLDCCTLPANFLYEAGEAKIDIVFGYSYDWYCKRDCEEILLPYLEKYFERVSDLKEGDIISYRWGRANYAHLAINLGDNMLLHCRATHGVEISESNAPCFYDAMGRSRVTGYWRIKK